jgi:hypothetical protein
VTLADLGFTEREGMWVDAHDEVGGMETPAGTFVGWIDVEWLRPAEPVRWLRDVVHVPPSHQPELARIVARAHGLRGEMLRLCTSCGERKVPGHMHTTSVGHARCRSRPDPFV